MRQPGAVDGGAVLADDVGWRWVPHLTLFVGYLVGSAVLFVAVRRTRPNLADHALAALDFAVTIQLTWMVMMVALVPLAWLGLVNLAFTAFAAVLVYAYVGAVRAAILAHRGRAASAVYPVSYQLVRRWVERRPHHPAARS